MRSSTKSLFFISFSFSLFSIGFLLFTIKSQTPFFFPKKNNFRKENSIIFFYIIVEFDLFNVPFLAGICCYFFKKECNYPLYQTTMIGKRAFDLSSNVT